MALFYIVRHAQCGSNVEGMIQGQIDSPLTQLGLRQARAAADRLSGGEFAAVYSSDLSRARDTARAIASPHGLPVQTTPLLRECCLGAAQGLTEAEFARLCPDDYRMWKEDPVSNRPPGAERFEDVIERCARFLGGAAASHSADDAILVVGHVGSVSGLICAAFDLPVRVYLAIHVANASLSMLESGDRPALRLLNDTCHLSGLT